MPDYSIRNYRHSDFDNYVRLRQQAESFDPIGLIISPQYITDRMKNPNYTPERDLFLAETNDELTGYMEITPERGSRWVILSCWIHPDHRRKGLVKEFLDRAEKRAGELNSDLLQVNINENNQTAISILVKLGFTFVRKFLDIELDMEKIDWQNISYEELDCRHLHPGEEAKLVEIQNHAFADHWGFNPNTIEDIIYSINRSDSSHEDVIVTCEGDRFTGYCWTEIPVSSSSDKKRGVIYMIGIDPAYRGTGTGRRVLLAGLMSLRERGAEVTTLTVDSENTVARTLYESVGFENQSTSLWYEKVIE